MIQLTKMFKENEKNLLTAYNKIKEYTKLKK